MTNPYVLSGDNRYEKAKDLLQGYGENFSISNAFDVLRSVRQEGLWATRVSFIYSVAKNKGILCVEQWFQKYCRVSILISLQL